MKPITVPMPPGAYRRTSLSLDRLAPRSPLIVRQTPGFIEQKTDLPDMRVWTLVSLERMLTPVLHRGEHKPQVVSVWEGVERWHCRCQAIRTVEGVWEGGLVAAAEKHRQLPTWRKRLTRR